MLQSLEIFEEREKINLLLIMGNCLPMLSSNWGGDLQTITIKLKGMPFSSIEIETKFGYKPVTINEIDFWIKEEFDNCYYKFKRNIFTWKQIKEYSGEVLNGIYIFHIPEVIWKIGKHQVDAVMRARQHISDNTGIKQSEDFAMSLILEYAEKCSVIVYSPINKMDIHWILALEAFLEQKAREENCLLIKSARIG